MRHLMVKKLVKPENLEKASEESRKWHNLAEFSL